MGNFESEFTILWMPSNDVTGLDLVDASPYLLLELELARRSHDAEGVCVAPQRDRWPQVPRVCHASLDPAAAWLCFARWQAMPGAPASITASDGASMAQESSGCKVPQP